MKIKCVVIAVALKQVVAPVGRHGPFDAFLPEAAHKKAQGAHAQDDKDGHRQGKNADQTL